MSTDDNAVESSATENEGGESLETLKAELAEAKAKADKAEARAKDREEALKRISEAKKRKADRGEDGTDDADLDSRIEASLAKDRLEDEIGRLGLDDDDRKSLMEAYEKRIARSGSDRASIRRDLDDAKRIAFAGRTDAETKAKARQEAEREHAERSHMRSSGGSSASRQPPKADADANLSYEERSYLDRVGDYKKRNGLA
jgi:hypothetical protein